MQVILHPLENLTLIRYIVKRVDIDPNALVILIKDNSVSLKELYLNEVYIKVFGSEQREETPLWIGHQDVPRHEGCCWVAQALREMEGLQLKILRVTGLGYDDFEPDRSLLHPNYDLIDPSGLDISFDQRFVEAVMKTSDANNVTVPPPTSELPQTSSETHIVTPPLNLPNMLKPLSNPASLSEELDLASLTHHLKASEYDVEVFQRLRHNSTSHFKRCIDGYFNNHNERALLELQRIIAVADRGMALISDEIDRSHAAEITAMGNIAIP
jgi:hypothetical protein